MKYGRARILLMKVRAMLYPLLGLLEI